MHQGPKDQEDKQMLRILQEFKGIKSISSIKSAKKRTLILPKNETSEVDTSRNGIVNVFGEFYCKLYADDQCDETELERQQCD